MILEAIRELQLRLRELDKHLRQVHAPQVGSKTIRDNTRAIVDQYFRVVRASVPERVEIGEFDPVMQSLLECAQRYTTVRKYRNAILEGLKLLGRVEKLALLHGTSARRDTAIEPVDKRIVDILAQLVPSAALSYEQALVDLGGDSRLSWRGPATDLREALRETLDQLAPDKQVVAQAGFKLEKDCSGPTMKQKVRFVLSSRGLSRTTMEAPEQAAAAVEEAVGSFVRSVYTRSNVSTHTPTDKDEVLRVRDWVRVTLCELLEIRQ